MHRQQDAVLRKAARLALHCPPSVRNDYIHEIAKLEPSEKKTLRLANQYLCNNNRCESVKALIQRHQCKQIHKYKRKTLLDIIMN